MSAAKDSIVVKCTNRGLPSRDAALCLLNPEWLKIPVTLNLGNGNNSVLAGLGYAGWDNGINLDAQTRLLSGTGNDIIKGSGKAIGIYVGGTISTGAGNDIIEGNGISSSGITASEGSINMGDGNDRLTGIGGPESSGWGSNYVSGWIDMGGGNDEITGTSFMVRGPYEIQMGSGNDKFLAPLRYSNSPIDFGSGTDKLYLPSGKYTVTDNGSGEFSLSSLAQTEGWFYGHGAESISGLEWLVSARTGAKYAFAAGTLDIA